MKSFAILIFACISILVIESKESEFEEPTVQNATVEVPLFKEYDPSESSIFNNKDTTGFPEPVQEDSGRIWIANLKVRIKISEKFPEEGKHQKRKDDLISIKNLGEIVRLFRDFQCKFDNKWLIL